MSQPILIYLYFQSAFAVHGVHDEMVVPMIAVDMRCHDNLETVERFSHLNPDFVDKCRTIATVRRERLNILFEEYSLCLAVLMLGRHKLLICRLRHAVLSAHKFDAAKQGLFILHHIFKHSAHS